MLEEWLGRTVIRSCAKLTYAHAQMMLDGADDAGPDGPPLHCGYTWSQVGDCKLWSAWFCRSSACPLASLACAFNASDLCTECSQPLDRERTQVAGDVRSLGRIAKRLRVARFLNGAPSPL